MKNTEETFEETLVHGSEEELQELKAWLFRENIRLATATKELERMQEQFLKEKVQFQEEMKLLNHKISSERQRLKEDNQFFEKKLEILQSGFSQLDIDRRRLEKEWARLAAEREIMAGRTVYENGLEVSVLFQGVSTPLALMHRIERLIREDYG